MDVPDVVREWSVRCAQCGDCRVAATVFLPSCPPGARFKFNSYYATGRMVIGRGLQEGALTLEDDDVLESRQIDAVPGLAVLRMRPEPGHTETRRQARPRVRRIDHQKPDAKPSGCLQQRTD